MTAVRRGFPADGPAQEMERSMNMIVAFIKPHLVVDVVMALQNVEGLTCLRLSEIHGFGRGRALTVTDRQIYPGLERVPRTRLVIAFHADMVATVLAIIHRV